jgi:hypothetical protein
VTSEVVRHYEELLADRYTWMLGGDVRMLMGERGMWWVYARRLH